MSWRVPPEVENLPIAPPADGTASESQREAAGDEGSGSPSPVTLTHVQAQMYVLRVHHPY